MSITPEQRLTINQIVSIYETGELPSPAAYGSASVLDDGAGVSYGLHQATAKSGSLQAVLRDYFARGGSLGVLDLETALDAAAESVGQHPDRISPRVSTLLQALRRVGGDARMREAQEHVFDKMYWQPAATYARSIGLVLPLSYLVCYDTWIQSGASRIDLLRGTFPEKPPLRGGPEKAWSVALLKARGHWLAQSDNVLVRRSVYRVDSLLDLAEDGNWQLARPLVVRGHTLA